MHHSHKTIQNYLSPDFSVTNVHYNVRISGKLIPYEKEDGKEVKTIFDVWVLYKDGREEFQEVKYNSELEEKNSDSRSRKKLNGKRNGATSIIICGKNRKRNFCGGILH